MREDNVVDGPGNCGNSKLLTDWLPKTQLATFCSDPETLRDRLCELLSNPLVAERLGQAAADFAQQ